MIYDEQPPEQTDDDLSEYLTRQFRAAKYEDSSITSKLDSFVEAAYGGGTQEADITPYDIPITTYITVPMDTLSPSVFKGMTVNLTNDTFTFNRPGVWLLLFTFDLAGYVSSSQNRRLTFRTYNTTTSTPGEEYKASVGRNTEDLYLSLSVLIQVTDAGVKNQWAFRMELGDASTAITGGTLQIAVIQATHVSELGA